MQLLNTQRICKSAYGFKLVRGTIMKDNVVLHASLSKLLTKFGMDTPTKVQSLAMPRLMTLTSKHEAFLVGAETGSGKTLAFGLPILNRILNNPELKSRKNFIFVPSKELMYQTVKVLNTFAIPLGIDCRALAPGKYHPPGKGGENLPQIIVSTPILAGQSGNLGMFDSALPHTDFVVFDEADHSISSSGYDQCSKDIFLSLRKQFKNSRESGMKLVFTGATLPSGGEKTFAGVVRRSFKNAEWICTNELHFAPEGVDQEFISVEDDKSMLSPATDLVSKLAIEGKRVVVFVSEGYMAEDLMKILEKRLKDKAGVGALAKQIPFDVRMAFINQFWGSEGKVSVMVCTDLAARGLDFKNVDVVVQAQFAKTAQTYLHRIGRTARCGEKGRVVSFYTPVSSDLVEHLQTAIKNKQSFATGFSRNRGFRNRIRNLKKRNEQDNQSL